MRNKRAPVFTRKLISLVMPIAFQQFMLALVSASDAWRNFLGFTVSGISGRTGYFYSQPASRSYDYWSFSYSCPVLGQGRYSGSREDIRLVTKVTTVISLIFTLSALLLSGMLMRIFTNDLVLIWRGSLYLRVIAAFVLKLPVLAVYFIISLDEIVKIPVVYLNYKKYRWGKDLTVKSE